jgi:GNAT superfamily N-acetyltransferase
MIPESDLKDNLRGRFDEPVRVTIEEEVTPFVMDPIETLHNTEIISEREGIRSELQVHSEKSDEQISKITWMSFVLDKVAYIDWIEVAESRQRDGIGSTIRNEVLEDLRLNTPISKVYTKPMTEAGKGLVQSQGFTPDPVLSNGNWHSLSF